MPKRSKTDPDAARPAPGQGDTAADRTPAAGDTRDRLMGLGKSSIRKSYYPELQKRVRELERFRVLLDHSSEAIFMADAGTGVFFDVNATAATMLGCAPQDMENAVLSDIFPAHEAERFREHMSSPTSRQSVLVTTTEMQFEDGPEVPVEVSVSAAHLAEGSYGVISARDITERLMAEKALRESEDKYRNIFENALEGIFRTSPDGKILAANQSMAEIVGFESPEQLMHECNDLGSQMYENKLDRKRLRKLLEVRKELTGFETRFRRRDDRLIWVSINARAVVDEQENVEYYEGSFLDISARKELEEREHNIKEQLRTAVRERTRALLAKTRELQDANKRLLELDELKSAFLSSVSHELRTPLTSILGFTRLIQRDLTSSILNEPRDKTQARRGQRVLENLGIIQAEGERLTRLINDFLDLSKIESGRIEWRDIVIRPADIVREVFESVRGQFDQNPELSLKLDVGLELPVLRMDPDRIKQVLLNLLSNAYKFTEKGSIVLEAHAEDSGAALVFRVRDTGGGIATEDLEIIFDRFQQARQPNTAPSSGSLLDKPRGTGLGLAISRQIIQHYGGNIWVESTLGKGSVFTVRLPSACRCDDKTVEEDLKNFHEGRKTLLVVDDDRSITEFLSQTLEQHGFNVAVAACGENALHKARRLKPDLITMDLLMPGMDGRDAIMALRRSPETADIPILVISVVQEGHNAGGDAALVKPVTESTLLDAVSSLLERHQPEHTMLALHDNGKAHLDPYFTLCEGCIIHCTEEELWAHIEDGFKGTVIVSHVPTFTKTIDRLHAIPDIHLLLLPSTAGN